MIGALCTFGDSPGEHNQNAIVSARRPRRRRLCESSSSLL